MQRGGGKSGAGADRIVRAVVFAALCCALFAFLNVLFRPIAGAHENQTLKGFYAQPGNTIEVVFLGTSSIERVSPVTVYEDAGICSYTLGTPQQPLVMTYYWLKEAYRLHGDTLKVVVVDPSNLFYSQELTNDADRAERSVAYLAPSPVKAEALLELNRHYRKFSITQTVFPLLKYHDRWESLKQLDFDSLFGIGEEYFTRGQNVSFVRSNDALGSGKMPTLDNGVTLGIDYDESAIAGSWQDYNYEMLSNIVDFCDEKGLDLLFAKFPKQDWSDLKHDALRAFADDRGVPLLDFNEQDLLKEVGLALPSDFADYRHLNYYGAEKISSFLAGYLSEQYRLADTRGDGRYSFMDDDVACYAGYREDAELQECTSLAEYLALLRSERFTVFVALKGAVDLEGMPLHVAEALGRWDMSLAADGAPPETYVAVLESGRLVAEASGSEGAKAKLAGAYADGDLVMDKLRNQKKAKVPGCLVVESRAGADEAASITLGEDELSENLDGLNFAVYDRYQDVLVDTSCFDLTTGDRTSDQVPESYGKGVTDAPDDESDE